ncbi:MAG: DUF2877 domain-containing protein [Eubacteriales bacterium]|nr:DUF2877 domain-containing protein [Eubacteriales bacterium]
MNTPVTIDIQKTSDAVMERFRKLNSASGPYRGMVHSVYRHTVNLQFPDSLLAIQCQGSAVSPISLILPLDGAQMDALPITQNAPCFMYPNHIEIHDKNSLIIFSLKESVESYPASVQSEAVQSTSSGEYFRDGIHQVIANSGKNGFAYIVNDDPRLKGDFILQGAKKYIQETGSFLESGDAKKAAASLVRVVGLGTGLTPCGDDFLCGVLALLQSTSLKESSFTALLSRHIQKNLANTNDISGEFLQSAIRGQYSEPVIQLLSCRNQGVDEIVKAAETFLSIGHSSGVDTLCGMLWVLDFVK